MTVKTSSNYLKGTFFALVFAMILIPFHAAFAQDAEGITIEKDVVLESPIQGAEDLPEEVTFTLYGSEDSVDPLATQDFLRGAYTLDFDFNKSDGLSSGAIARFKVNFTNKLDLGSTTDEPAQPKEIWVEFSVGDSVIGSRSLVPDETMVQLLLASDASIATYLTLAYEGDGNPITTIYKDLPISSLAGEGATGSLRDYFSAVAATGGQVTGTADTRAAENWVDSGANVYTMGEVSIGISTEPVGSAKLLVQGGGINSLSASGGNVVVGEGLGENEYGGYVWNATSNTLQFATASANAITFGHYNGTVERMRIDTNGAVGIGTASPIYTLAVNGTIGCKELTVTSTGWADFVFENNYRLPPLSEVETFISENKHLPGIPTEAEVKEKGVNVGNISSKLLQKVEELTLYMIDLKKENGSLKAQLTTIQEQLNRNQD